MLFELCKKWVIETNKNVVVVFDFDDSAAAAKFIKPYVSTTKGPAVADLSEIGEITIVHSAEKTFDKM